MRRISSSGVLIPVVLSMILVACSSDDGSEGNDDCTQGCAKADVLHCANEVAGRCASECQQLNMMAVCKSEWDTWMSCSANATYACNDMGEAKPRGCDTQEGTYFACLFGGGRPTAAPTDRAGPQLGAGDDE